MSGVALRDGVMAPLVELRVTSWLRGEPDSIRVDVFRLNPQGGRDLGADLHEHALPLIAAAN